MKVLWLHFLTNCSFYYLFDISLALINRHGRLINIECTSGFLVAQCCQCTVRLTIVGYFAVVVGIPAVAVARRRLTCAEWLADLCLALRKWGICMSDPS
ncbi:hypothetical protein J6590_012279 [Homalodisca vitripennis]|nr:hypothetical protein J6590_012279 [Homalodisca vitripennis]